ncbi:MAG: Wzz/FepE/Etk N-terminal domain-containing protein [Nitrospirota bacterium]
MRTAGAESGNSNNEISLFDYWGMLVKGRGIIIGIVLISVVITASLAFLAPTVYQGEGVLKVSTDGVITAKAVGDIINGERADVIFPKNADSVESHRAGEGKGSADKLIITIEGKKADLLQHSFVELLEFVNNLPEIQRSIESEKEKLALQLKELTILVKDSEGANKHLERANKEGRAVFIGITPVQLNKAILDAKVERLVVEHKLKKLTGIEPIGKLIITKKPNKLKRKVVLAGMSGLFVGIFIVSIMQYRRRQSGILA